MSSMIYFFLDASKAIVNKYFLQFIAKNLEIYSLKKREERLFIYYYFFFSHGTLQVLLPPQWLEKRANFKISLSTSFLLFFLCKIQKESPQNGVLKNGY